MSDKLWPDTDVPMYDHLQALADKDAEIRQLRESLREQIQRNDEQDKRLADLQQKSAEQHESYGKIVGRLNVAEAERDSWRRVAERLEGENQSLKARVETLGDALSQVGVVLKLHGITDTAKEVARILRPTPQKESPCPDAGKSV